MIEEWIFGTSRLYYFSDAGSMIQYHKNLTAQGSILSSYIQAGFEKSGYINDMSSIYQISDSLDAISLIENRLKKNRQ